MGLAPQIVEEIFEIVKDLNFKEGVSFLLAGRAIYLLHMSSIFRTA